MQAPLESAFGIGVAGPLLGLHMRSGRPPPSCSNLRGPHSLPSREASQSFQTSGASDSSLSGARQRSSSPPLFLQRCPSSSSAATPPYWRERSQSFSPRSPREPRDVLVRCASGTNLQTHVQFPHRRSLSFSPGLTRETVDAMCRTASRAPPPITRCPSMQIASPLPRTRSLSFRSRVSRDVSDSSMSPRQTPGSLVRCSSREAPLIRQHSRGYEDAPRHQLSRVNGQRDGIFVSRAVRSHSSDRGTIFLPGGLVPKTEPYTHHGISLSHSTEYGMSQVRTSSRSSGVDLSEADSKARERELNRQRLAEAIENRRRAKAQLYASPGFGVSPKDASSIRARAAARLASSGESQTDPRTLGLGGSCSIEEEIEFRPVSDDEDAFDDIMDWPSSAATSFVDAFRALSPRRETSPLRFLEPVIDHLDKARDVVTRPCVQRKTHPSRKLV